MNKVPAHLKKYVVKQNVTKYTPIQHASWRFIIRQLKHFMSQKAHSSYLKGLKATGIDSETIPSIQSISQKLNKFGWSAVPVSGFVPPTAFFEFQARGILPIASDMRTLEHLLYTPAPDIVHEAAGHAPMLVNKFFRTYLKNYGEMATKAIISKGDIDLYEAIRDLSDIKENPRVTTAQIKKAEKKLIEATRNVGPLSEAAYLTRLGWWTTEYGLIRENGKTKIFGAGLLSSLGESDGIFKNNVKKIPLSLKCLDYSYNITEPQPQLFVVNKLEELNQQLEDLKKTFSFVEPLKYGVHRALDSQMNNTFKIHKNMSLYGKLTDVVETNKSRFMLFQKALGLDYKNLFYHLELPLLLVCSEELKKGLEDISSDKNKIRFKLDSGLEVELHQPDYINHDQVQLSYQVDGLSVFKNHKKILDIKTKTTVILSTRLLSIQGGVPLHVSRNQKQDFAVKKTIKVVLTSQEKKLNQLYKKVAEYRNQFKLKKIKVSEQKLKAIYNELQKSYGHEWLLRLEMFEILATQKIQSPLKEELLADLKAIMASGHELAGFIKNGIELCEPRRSTSIHR